MRRASADLGKPGAAIVTYGGSDVVEWIKAPLLFAWTPLTGQRVDTRASSPKMLITALEVKRGVVPLQVPLCVVGFCVGAFRVGELSCGAFCVGPALVISALVKGAAEMLAIATLIVDLVFNLSRDADGEDGRPIGERDGVDSVRS